MVKTLGDIRNPPIGFQVKLLENMATATDTS